ncbi:hypothetical protein F5146DRAFT_1124225 [Armillaria mellea]|nr:hypothetical protein F5146DRAFT_1124225 [Armillaria mellea]
MSACNHTVFSARSTIGPLFASIETIGLGVMSPFDCSPQEDARTVIVAPPLMSRSTGVKFWLDSSSPIFHPSISISSSTHLSRTANSEPYNGIANLDRLDSKTEETISVSKCCCASDTNAFTTACRKKLASTSASSSIYKQYGGLGLGAPPMRCTSDNTRDESSTSPRLDEVNAILGTLSSSPAPRRVSPMASEPKRHPGKQPAGLGLGLPPSISLRTATPLVSSSTISVEPLGIGMLTSSLSISSDLCRLTSHPPSKLPPRRPQPQPRLRTRTRPFSSEMPHLTVCKFTKRLLYTIPESSTASPFQGHRRAIGKDGGSEGAVGPFGRTLF